MSSLPLPFDVCSSRHKGNPLSRQANLRVHSRKPAVREILLSMIEGSGGITIFELLDLLNAMFPREKGWAPNHISGRLSELKALGKIQVVGERDGAGVWRNV